jgi:hypothetical protein
MLPLAMFDCVLAAAISGRAFMGSALGCCSHSHWKVLLVFSFIDKLLALHGASSNILTCSLIAYCCSAGSSDPLSEFLYDLQISNMISEDFLPREWASRYVASAALPAPSLCGYYVSTCVAGACSSAQPRAPRSAANSVLRRAAPWR